MSGNDETGENRQTEPRWQVIYGGVVVFTLMMIAALFAFSAYFAA